MRTLFTNAKVYTGELPIKDSFMVENGVFVSGGTPDETVDLGGRFVCAGFNDSHMHLLNFGKFLRGASLAEHTGSLAELKRYLGEYISEKRPADSEWVFGRGWNQDYFSDVNRMPDRRDLDEVCADIPIMITRTCGHCCVLNSAALSAAGIDASTAVPDGGSIGMQDGEPDGRLYENAIDLATTAVPSPGKEAIKEMLREASGAANSYGITSVQSDDYRVFSGVDPMTVNEAYRELAGEGGLTVRVTEQCNFPGAAELKAFIEAGGFEGGDPMFRTGPLKMLGDGSLGSRTARLSVPYPGTDDRGVLIFSDEEMYTMISLAAEAGRGAVVHAIGDGCLDQVLRVFRRVHEERPGDRRDAVIHCQVSRPEQLEEMAGLGLGAMVQSIFLDYDNHIVTQLVPDSARDSSYSWRTLIDLGVSVSNGSDCPVELPDVMKGIQCAVTRTSMDGTGPYLPDEAFSVRQALDSFTKAGARASMEEDIKGVIADGMLADFTVLSDDPFECDPCALSSIRAEQVWLGGRRVF